MSEGVQGFDAPGKRASVLFFSKERAAAQEDQKAPWLPKSCVPLPFLPHFVV